MTANIKIVLITNILFFLLCWNKVSYAQNGANFKAGVVLVGDVGLNSFSDTAFHMKGYHIGVDARIGPYGFYLSPGLHYYNFDMEESQGFSFLSRAPKYHIIKGPLNLGYKMFITRKLKFRVNAGLDINYILLIDDNMNDIDFDSVNDAYFGVNIGAGMDISRFTIDVNYESGLTDALKDVEDSKFNYITASLGFFF